MPTIDTTAPVIVRLSSEIDAPLETVWSLHTRIDDWPLWNTGIDQARLEAPLAEGTTFTWRTHGLDITSTVHELVPGARIVWGGPVNGIEGVHVWTFEQNGDRVLVHTEESWSGAPVEAAADQLRDALRNSLEDWLTCLKNRAEKHS
ncbi:SRPBCC family protein [Kitasatospora purpeofusca]|uniref:SRPBCC family protein n=1 Tax=Kitasatospora purpeofusca TaxID=67352 RepID=UPI0036EDF6D4